MSSNNQTDNSIGPTLLLITFLVLKLTHVIDWSWWWVLSPLWITAAIVVVVVVGTLLIAWITRRR